MSDIITQVVDQVGIRVVGDDNASSAIDCADQTGKARAGAKLEHRVVFYELACMLLEIIGECAASVPKEMSLVRSAIVETRPIWMTK